MMERRLVPLAFASVPASVLLLLCPAIASAQTWSTAELRQCVALEDDGERLACFDRLAAEKLSAAASGEEGSRRYSTLMEGRGDRSGDRRSDAYRARFRDIRIVAFVHEHRRGRDWRRYVSDDGRYWRLRDDQPDGERELPFAAEVIPDPEAEGGYLLRPEGDGAPIRVLAEREQSVSEPD
ncbi:hypothetical protein [Lentisalinibacter sediminis]|uniref:hypothetical protein n=1 Tax=Lentisalinibacter sediminis TaxID=2992237 RepID=UPI0038648927